MPNKKYTFIDLFAGIDGVHMSLYNTDVEK